MIAREQPKSQLHVADAVPGNWVDSWAPAPIRPYLRLARADRPIGTWLLLWPCWWSVALATLAKGQPYPDLWHLLLFALGALVMRAAGCTYNDIVDRHYDARVARTRSRPIPSGQVSVRAAFAFAIALSLTGLLILLQFNPFTIWLGISSLALVAIYPFMKRVTHWPQLVLGLVFNWGALMGWAASFGQLSMPALFLYVAAIFWTVGYDTIYAHQDKEDDALLGLKSTALKFGEATKPWLTLFYTLAFAGLMAAGLLAGAGAAFVLMMLVAGAHFVWQIVTLDLNDPANCLSRFRANHYVGGIVFAAIAGDALVGALMS